MKLATLCYVRNGDKTLMLHRDKNPNDFQYGQYNGLGGKFEEGESPEQCVIREVKEESGIVIRNPRLKGIVTFDNRTEHLTKEDLNQVGMFLFILQKNLKASQKKQTQAL